jgi:hypothetical protein
MRDATSSRRLFGRRSALRGLRADRKPSALAILAGVIVLLAMLLSGCDAHFFGASATASAATPTATPVPTVAPDKGGASTLPALTSSVARCSQVEGFQTAQAASAGAAFADTPFPPESVSVNGAATDNLYHFQVVNVCNEGAGATAVLTFYASGMRTAGWMASATYPYGGAPGRPCGDSYCWRKADKTVRYVSLEHLSSSGVVTIYALRLVTAPAPTAGLVVRSASGAGRGGAALTVSASCQGGEQMLGGGYNISGSDHASSAQSSYPSGPATWMVSTVGAGSATFELQTYVGCLHANYSLGIQIVPTTFAVTAGGASQPLSAACAGGVVTGGGAHITGSGALLADSAPTSGLKGWNVVATAGSSSAKGTAYALCATHNLDAGPSTSRAFTISSNNDNGADLACAAGQWLTSGGFSNVDPSADGKNVYPLNAPTADYSRWFLQGHNLDAASAHGALIWAVCVIPDPQF